jgi:hypothetical protein
MKRILAAALLALPLIASAKGLGVIATSQNVSGGTNALIADDGTDCDSKIGFIGHVPFQGYIRGCVTNMDETTVHVALETGGTLDLPMTTFTMYKKQSKSTKGSL